MLTLALIALAVGSPTMVVLDPSRTEIANWQGFGCSLSWWGVFTASWPKPAQREVCRRLFGTGPDCLGWNVVRYNAGGTSPDADPKRFRPGGKVQVTLDPDGSFHPERDAAQMACLNKAKRLGANVIELFVNSPPHWMLRNGDTHGGDDGGENLKPECEPEYARWLSELTARIERHAGVRFVSVAPFNEPSAPWWRADTDGQEGCRILPPAQARIIRELRKALDRRLPRIMIACSDEHNPHTGFETFTYLTNPAEGNLSRAEIGRVNVHAYAAWDWQERFRELVASRGIPLLWMSEVSHREWENAGYIPNDMRCALPQTRAVVSDIKRLRPNAWVFWQAVEPLQFCVWYRFTYGLIQAAADAPVEWNGRTFQPGEYIVSKAFWAMMQFSRFIRPGYRFLRMDDSWTLAAMAPDGRRLVIVVHHDEKTPRALALDLSMLAGLPAKARVWRTMDDADGVVWNCRAMPSLPIRGARMADIVPARSVTTYTVDLTRPNP